MLFQIGHILWTIITFMTFQIGGQKFLTDIRRRFNYSAIELNFLVNICGTIYKNKTFSSRKSISQNKPRTFQKNFVLKLFQWTFVFRLGELKSFEITCKWSRCILGSEWYPILNVLSSCPVTSMTFFANNSSSFISLRCRSEDVSCSERNFFSLIENLNEKIHSNFTLLQIQLQCPRREVSESGTLLSEICP